MFDLKEQFSFTDNLIKRSRNVLILGHVDPDGDAISSILALNLVLKNCGIRTYIGCSNVNQQVYRFLSGFEDILYGYNLKQLIASDLRSSKEGFDLIIIVDVAQLPQLGDIYSLYPNLFEAHTIINIDHHSSNTMFGKINVVISDYVSTTEILFEFFKQMSYKYDHDIATCLLTGIIIDTSRFTTANVTSHTFRSAAQLVDAGGDLLKINQFTTPSESVEKAKVMASLISKLQSSEDKQIVWITVGEDLPLDIVGGAKSVEKITSNLASYLRALEGVKVSAVFYKRLDNSVKVSLRGRPNVDVLSVALKFGGGGHLEAAGCILENTPIDIAENMIIEEVKRLKI